MYVYFKTKTIHTLAALYALVLLLSGAAAQTDEPVQVREDSLVIPTYLVNPPNPMPRFYEGRTHQGVQRRVYPYPMNDGLTREKQDRSYHIVYFDNDYIHLGIMPGMGGRIFFAEDKTNEYVWFYRQHVIKPSLIGMLGYWISGSNAWGFPHHHGPNTVKPMDYHVERNDDGSQTIWIANTDRRHRMRILIAYTVFPSSSLVEMRIRLMNRTPVVNSFLFWANPSVHVDTTYQVIFPPSVQYVTQHAKREMNTWPIADRRYNRFAYEGVDISLWKNIGVPSSFFSWDPKEDYFGGYNHGKQAGTVWVGNHYICPGMKFWAWGNNPGGDRANAGLTDNDGHYLELMTGAYTDNQPDYSWLQPYETKSVTMIWFPIRELGGLKYASRNGALNLEVVKQRIAQIRINTTSPYEKAQVVLKAKEDILLAEKIDINPAKPYSKDVRLPEGTVEDDLHLYLTDAVGEQLLSYKPAEHHPPDYPIPEALKPPRPPEEIKTIEELYLTGLRLDQFYNASLDPMPYYQQALKRDSADYRVNTQLGILYIKHKQWQEAEEHLRLAVNRITSNYTRPKDGEAHYYLGIALKAQNKWDEAYDQFYRAAWSAAWHTPAYYQLAEIDCHRGAYETALDHLNRAMTTHVNNLTLLNLKTVVLRKLDQKEEAEEQALCVLQQDVLNHQARNELLILKVLAGDEEEAGEMEKALMQLMRNEVQSYLELATDYANSGFYQEAIDLLTRLEKEGNRYPMLYYYLGYYYAQMGEEQKAAAYYQTACEMPHTYCFPFRDESINILRHAMNVNSKDARAPYYLGNLLYEHQPANAIKEWEKSRELDDSFYIVHRNLGLAYEEVQQDVAKALASYEQSVACNSNNARLLFEIDELYEKNKVSPEKKYALLKENSETVRRRSETLLRLATRSVEVGNYDEALDILLNNEFPQFEGGREMQDTYLNAFTLRGMAYYDGGDYDKAMKDFEEAMAYPVGRWGRSRWAQFHYLIGTVHAAQGETEQANESYQQALNIALERRGSDRQYLFYHGMAYKKLGKVDEAENTFQEMLEMTQQASESAFFIQFEAGLSRDMRVADNHYLAGLAYQGLEQIEKASAAFTMALELDPGHIWARQHLASLQEE
jgi:tetratricopeptide (TPR) repeat protein